MATMEQTATATTGTVTGTVTASPAVQSYVGVRVALVRRATGKVVAIPAGAHPVAADGTFQITNAPAGQWGLLCYPAGNLPLCCLTYPALVGLDLTHGKNITVTAGSTTSVHLALPPAGYVQVFVTASDTGLPLPNATVLSYETSSRQAFAVPPTASDQAGQALLSNVPFRSTLIVLGPPGYGTATAVGPDGSTLLTLGRRGNVLTVNVQLDPA